ncbi:MAG: outer membrane protein assembly factor [Bacteroidota bacterium]|nr:outer membrane protein assembly factor [Bacteroidota bacterium]
MICFQAFGDCAISKDKLPPRDTTTVDSAKQKDISDFLSGVFNRKGSKKKPDVARKFTISLVPTAGYTLSTGFTIGASSITTFFTESDHTKNESVINLQAFYDSHSQQTLLIQSNIWSKNDQWKFVTDLRVTKYPDVTYGLGSATTTSTADNIVFNYIRFYQTFLKKVAKSFYAGGGYDLDYHYNISEQGTANNTISTFKRYGETSSSRSSGFNLGALFDNRTNPLNSLGGIYANLIYRNNLKFMGSDSRWSSMQLDVRKYFKLSDHSNNVLAFWSYTWLILNGKPPYLDLPSVGNDTYNNTGRGYAIDRFRGKNMLYLESEYRFGITANGLIGGVAFANVESYPRNVTTNIRKFLPAAGSGIRIKMNKHTNTNLGIDYGIGTGGSRGVFVNLGEVF